MGKVPLVDNTSDFSILFRPTQTNWISVLSFGGFQAKFLYFGLFFFFFFLSFLFFLSWIPFLGTAHLGLFDHSVKACVL